MTYVVIWDGSMKVPLPGVGSIQRRACYLTQGAIAMGELLGSREMTGKGLSDAPLRPRKPKKKRNKAIAKPCPCGRMEITAAQVEHRIANCRLCRAEARGPKRAGKPCVTCGVIKIPKLDWQAGLYECHACRKLRSSARTGKKAQAA